MFFNEILEISDHIFLSVSFSTFKDKVDITSVFNQPWSFQI